MNINYDFNLCSIESGPLADTRNMHRFAIPDATPISEYLALEIPDIQVYSVYQNLRVVLKRAHAQEKRNVADKQMFRFNQYTCKFLNARTKFQSPRCKLSLKNRVNFSKSKVCVIIESKFNNY